MTALGGRVRAVDEAARRAIGALHNNINSARQPSNVKDFSWQPAAADSDDRFQLLHTKDNRTCSMPE